MSDLKWERPVALIATLAAVTLILRIAIAAPTTVSAGAVTKVKVVRDTRGDGFSSTTSQEFATVPGARTSVTVPSGTKGLVIVRWSGETSCTHAAPTTQFCTARIMVGNAQAEPKTVGAAFVFAGAAVSDSSGIRGFERSRGPVNPGTYPVRVQYRTTSGAEFTVDKWHMTVELVRV